jgi:hypothetical protein
VIEGAGIRIRGIEEYDSDRDPFFHKMGDSSDFMKKMTHGNLQSGKSLASISLQGDIEKSLKRVHSGWRVAEGGEVVGSDDGGVEGLLVIRCKTVWQDGLLVDCCSLPR